MVDITVFTEEELALAKKNKYQFINVEGSLADVLIRKKRNRTLLMRTFLTLLFGVFFISLMSFFTDKPPMQEAGQDSAQMHLDSSFSGYEIAAIISAVAIGITMIIAVSRGYEEIEVSPGKLKLRRKRNDT